MKQGVLYTMVSVLLVFVVATIFFTSARSQLESSAAIADRVRSIDTFISNIAVDSQRAAQIAGYRSMIAMEEEVTSSGAFFTDAESTFLEIFLSGNLSTKEYAIMQNSSFNEYIQRVVYEAGRQGILFDANVTNISLWQNEPWSIMVQYTLDMNVTDTRGTASWFMTRQFDGKIPIIELRDPLFTWGTLSRVQHVIIPTNVSPLVYDVGDANDTTGLIDHFNESYYIAAGRGPTMLMRFEGNFSDNIYGFESLVDIEDISAQGIAVNTTASIVDYKYFSGVDADACSVQNLPSTFKFATSDLDIYEVEGQLEYSSC